MKKPTVASERTPHQASPDAAPAAPSRPAAQEHAMDGAIAAALEDGMQCFNQKKYDCAIANANTVLRFSPGNRQAQDMKRRAKDAQDKALSAIQIQ